MKRTIVTVICLICFTSITWGQASVSDSYKKLYNEGSFKEAITSIAKIDTSKRSAEDWFYIGQSYSANKEVLLAVDAFKAAIEKNPKHNGYRLTYARALNLAGNTEWAVDQLNKVVEIDTTNIAALSDLGSIYMSIRKYDRAKIIYGKLLAQNNNDFLSHYNLALSEFSQNKNQSDTTLIQNHLVWSLINNPRFTPARDLLGNYYFAKQRYYNALAEFESSSYYKLNDAEAYYKIGLCLEKLKHFQAAIPSYIKAVTLDSTNGNYFSHLGYCYYLTNKADSAVFAYSKAALFDKDNPTVYQNLGMSYLKLDSLDAAKKAFNNALQNFGLLQMTFNLNQIGYINLKQNNYEEAGRVCEKVLALDPENVFANYNLARVYDEQKKNMFAIKYYKKSLSLMKDIPSMENEYKSAARRIKELEK